MDFLPFIKAVGTGQKRNRDLSNSEMKYAMQSILKEEVSPEQVSAFLLGWRVKGESTEELQGALEAFDDFIKYKPIKNSIEFGYPYDGKVKNPYLIFLTTQYLQKFDIEVSLHGDMLQPAKAGTTLKDICDQYNLPTNMYFMDRKEFFPELHKLSIVRNKLGIRTSLNTLEKLLGITKSDTAIVGAFHKPFIEKYITLFKDRYKRLIVIKGNEGTPEIFSKCSVIIVENDQITELKIDPMDFEINYNRSKQRISPDESLSLIQNPSSELLKLAKFNAAVILFLINRVTSINVGLKQMED
ncbi:MAG: glycosyl transferase [Epsilonproteobacteria bacterium]|nr:glycosyl transferase [Campylobacterota bacterium]